MVENTFGINDITIESKAKCYCPLGQDWYTNQFTVNFYPGRYIPDYCEMDNWITANINGKSMIIEEAVARLYEYLRDTYMPIELCVESYVDDAKHSAVTIHKDC